MTKRTGALPCAALYDTYGADVQFSGADCILDTSTFHASPEWAAKVGYNASGLQRIIHDTVGLLRYIRARWDVPDRPLVINGAIGPRADGYSATESMDPNTAEPFRCPQVRSYAAAGAGLVMAQTMTHVGEAIGIARAAAKESMPSVISFTVETDGRLQEGTVLGEAILAADTSTNRSPVHYLVNCGHPSHVAPAPAVERLWINRLGGIRANPSPKGYAEPNECTPVEDGDPDELAALLRDMHRRYQHYLCYGRPLWLRSSPCGKGRAGMPVALRKAQTRRWRETSLTHLAHWHGHAARPM